QIVLHPSRTTAAPPSIDGAAFQVIHFGPDDSAIPQLTGWWIPSAPNAHYANTTILFLPSGDGSLANSIPTLSALHALGVNIFAFDYRGYGQSAPAPPNQQHMLVDAEAAWQYLTASRHIPAQQILLYGTGVGASLATHLAITHPSTPALILDSPHADLLDVALRDRRSRFVPARLLFHEHFPLAAPLSTLRTPKLLISYATASGKSPAAFRTASDPKITVELTSPSEPLYTQALTRFLDQYLPLAPAPELVPTPAPSAQNPH
ncbi:MAG: alpha/beta fold hydrolase, partial [Edaphobacter sp.]